MTKKMAHIPRATTTPTGGAVGHYQNSEDSSSVTRVEAHLQYSHCEFCQGGTISCGTHYNSWQCSGSFLPRIAAYTFEVGEEKICVEIWQERPGSLTARAVRHSIHSCGTYFFRIPIADRPVEHVILRTLAERLGIPLSVIADANGGHTL